MDNALYDSISEELGEQLASAGQTKVPVVTCTIDRPLTEEDIAEYCELSGDLPAVKSDAKDLATLRAKHHQVARLFALNLPEGVISTITGYTEPWISTLKNSPSMVELISHYRAPGDNATKVMGEKLRLLADMSLEQLLAKVEAGELDANGLLAAIKLGADRSGNGPMAKIEQKHIHSIDEEQVRQIAESARRRSAERILPIEAVRQALPAPKPEGEDAG